MSSIRDIDRNYERLLASFTPASADITIFNLGMPSRKVLSAGVADMPIRLNGSKVMKKIRKHGFNPNELRGLTKAVRNPIAVFKNGERVGNYTILTTLKSKSRNFVVAIDIGKGSESGFNVVSTLFGKNGSSIIGWINKGYLCYVDTKKSSKLPTPRSTNRYSLRQ